MDHPFVPVTAQLKVLRNKLNSSTFDAVFGRSVEERQEAANQAVKLADQISRLLGQACEFTEPVIAFMNGSRQPLLVAVEEFIRVVEQVPERSQASVQPGGSTDMPRSPSV